MLRAIIFDFDGVIVDSEPLIMKLFQEMAANEGLTLTAEEYYRDYLALDDRGIVEQIFRRHGRPLDPARLGQLVGWKAQAYQEAIRDGLPSLPGSIEFIRRVAAEYPLAIASGSLRAEIEYLLTKLRVREKFRVLATAEDFERSKPHPEVYQKALAGLQELEAFQRNTLAPAECLAIEDAPGGVHAAQAAGIKCLALAHSRPAVELRHADWLFDGFPQVDFPRIQTAFK